MPLRQLTALHHAEHVVREVEEAKAVGYGRLRAPHLLGHVPEGQDELVHEHGVGARLLDRSQLLACDVLDEGQEKRVAVVRMPDDGRDGLQSCLPSGSPAALAGDQLPAARRPRPDEHGLDDALLPDRAGESGHGFAVDLPPRLSRIRVDGVDRDVREILLRGASDEDVEATAEAAPAAVSFRERSASSIATFQYASAPADRRS